MSKQIMICVLLGLVMLLGGGSALASESLDEDCMPGDSVILVVPEDPQPGYYGELHFCLYFCEGVMYVLQIPMCVPDQIPIVWWVPGCSQDPGGCPPDPECMPTSDVLFDPSMFYWDPSIPGWVFLLMFSPGGQEGCACVSLSGPLPGLVWMGNCWWLSVELTSFLSVAHGEDVLIEFVTASEANNDYFEIMRGTSADGAFAPITRIPSQGQSATEQHYSYLDRDVDRGQTYWYHLADVDLQGNRTEHRDMMTSAHVEVPMPLDYAVLQNYPNPFNASTEIRYAIPEAGHVTLNVYNAMGQLMTTLVNREESANTYTVMFDAEALPSGIYIYRLAVNDFTATQKMVLLR